MKRFDPIFSMLLLIPISALIVSGLSFYFSIKSWLESNRPLVTARVSTLRMGGNAAIPLTLVVENTGNRPAKNIRLTLGKGTALRPFLVEGTKNVLRKHVEACFSDEGVIPVLANGKAASNNFGVISNEENTTWQGDPKFDIQISYEDLSGRRFKSTMLLFVKEDQGFASGFWVRSKTEGEAAK